MNELEIYGEIGVDVLARDVSAQLSQMTGPVVALVDSGGGSIIEALKIYDAIAEHPFHKTARVIGSAFSAASFVLCSFDGVEVAPNAYIMAHRAYFDAGGDADTLESNAELLRSIESRMVRAYGKRLRKSDTDILAMLQRETFWDSKQALVSGMADRIVGRSDLVMAKHKTTKPTALRRRAMVLAANKGKEGAQICAPIADNQRVLREARAAWADAVAKHRANGLSPMDAVSAASRSHSKIREVLVLAANMK